MLVLSRKVTEVICIGEDVRVRIIDIGRGRVQIGIEAPKNVRVIRKEVLSDDDSNTNSQSGSRS